MPVKVRFMLHGSLEVGLAPRVHGSAHASASSTRLWTGPCAAGVKLLVDQDKLGVPCVMGLVLPSAHLEEDVRLRHKVDEVLHVRVITCEVSQKFQRIRHEKFSASRVRQQPPSRRREAAVPERG